MKEVEYKEFRIGELFDISTGSLLKTKETLDGNIPRISVRSDNNGILGYYDTEGNSDARHAENFISVNFFGNAFYHSYKASLEMKVHCLKLKNREFTEAIGLYLTSVLNKVFTQKHYSYGEQLSSTDLKNQNLRISLPVTPDGTPDWEYMQRYIEELEQRYIEELEQYLIASGLDDYNLTDEEKELLVYEKDTRKFKIGDLFDISTTRSINRNQIQFDENSAYDFIGRSTTNYGVQGHVDYLGYEPNPANTFSLVQVGESRCLFRENEWYASQNIFMLKPKFNMVSSIQLYLTTAIDKALQRYKEAYTYPTLTILNTIEITLPITSDGVPDWQYMHDYIKAIEKLVIKEVVDYKNKILKKTTEIIKEI